MRHKWLFPHGAVLFALALLAVFGLAAGVNLAQPPQGSWLNLEADISPGELAIGEGFLTTLILRNEGTEPATVDAVTAELPAGALYVGQAVGSDVDDADEVGPAQLRWTGPFTLQAGAELKIRYWALAGGQAAPGQYSVQVVALSGDQSLVSAEPTLTLSAGAAPEPPVSQPVRVEMAPALPSAVQVSKAALPTLVKPGSGVAYTVTFSNSGSTPVTLDTITDLLPSGFQYVGLAYGSQIDDEPTDQDEPEIVWKGDLVPAGGTLTLRYWLWVPQGTRGGATPYTNSVTAKYDTTTIGPAHADVRIDVYNTYLPLMLLDYTPPYFTVDKSAAPGTVDVGGTVTYTVQFTNGGDDPGVLDTIKDTLPTGFTFLSMAPGSDVTSPPSKTTGTIEWKGPFTVAAHDDLTLVYRVRSSNTEDTYENIATATTLVGLPPQAPASASVTVGPSIFFEDDFEDGIDEWTPFTNYWRLNDEQWFWDKGGGYGNSDGYTNWGNAGIDGTKPERGAHDSLTMYLGGDSQTWDDYRFQARFALHRGSQVGLWFRGTYKDVATTGQWVTGYYFVLRVRDDNEGETAILMQLRTNQEHGDETNPLYWYHFSNPMQLTESDVATPVEPGEWHQLRVEVEGAHLECYVDNERVITYTDTTGSVFLEGTVGFFTYGKWPSEAVVNFDDVLVEPLD